MSKKWNDSPEDFICERKPCKNRTSLRNRRSSSTKRAFRDKETGTIENHDVSLNNAVRRSPATKDCRCAVNETSILKKKRDHSKEAQNTICYNHQAASKLKRSDKKKREKKKAKRKNNRTKKKRKKKKKERNKRKNKSVSKCFGCTWFIEFLLKICCCSKNLDSSSTLRPCTDTCCCCSHCKCRFCGPGSDSKYVQCDEYEQSDPVASSGRESVDLHDSMNKVSPWRANEKNKKSRKCTTLKKPESPGHEIDNHFVLIPCPGKSMGASSDRSDNGMNLKKTDKETESSTKCLNSQQRFKKCQTPAKSSIKKETMLENSSVSESMSEISCSCKKADVKIPSRKHCKFQDTNDYEYDLSTPCENVNRGKTKKALHIMFDILFWPYTCLPKRGNDGNKKKEKMS